MNIFFEDFLRTNTTLLTHTVSRSCPNTYMCEKSNTLIKRKETVSEHLIGCLKLADFFFFSHTELLNQYNRWRVKELLEFHDDIEGLPGVGDVSIVDEEKRIEKEIREIQGLSLLASQYPTALREHFLACDGEFREKKTPESIFAHAIDKIQPIIYLSQESYRDRRHVKGENEILLFTEQKIRTRSGPSLIQIPIIYAYFEELLKMLKVQGYILE